jgi:PHD/YefM family antitoxin component YafN of YafNO toxin-antitoxin module
VRAHIERGSIALKTIREIKERYVVDEKGKRVGVLIDPKAYERILAALEELESIRAYDAAKIT